MPSGLPDPLRPVQVLAYAQFQQSVASATGAGG
jgi:hypothetical protein